LEVNVQEERLEASREELMRQSSLLEETKRELKSEAERLKNEKNKLAAREARSLIEHTIILIMNLSLTRIDRLASSNWRRN